MTIKKSFHLLLFFFMLLSLALHQLLFLLLQLLQRCRQRQQLLLCLLIDHKVFINIFTMRKQTKQTNKYKSTLMSLVRACISVVNSTHCSSSCCCFCMSLLSWSLSALVSFTALFSIWIWSCWSWISLRFRSILLEAKRKKESKTITRQTLLTKFFQKSGNVLLLAELIDLVDLLAGFYLQSKFWTELSLGLWESLSKTSSLACFLWFNNLLWNVTLLN